MGVNAFGWPYFGQGYAGQTSAGSGPTPADDFIVRALPDVAEVVALPDATFVRALPDPEDVEL